MENARTTSSRLLGLVMAVLIVAAMAVAATVLPSKAYADDAAVRDAANGVLKFNWHIDGEDYSRGSCFLIDDEYVITAYHCTMFSSKELEARGYSGTSLQDLRDRMTYSVTINRDVKVGATLVNYSEEQDFAILKLDQKLGGYKALKFRDSSTVKAAETVWSVGFPANSDLKVINTYTSDDVTFKRGAVSKPEGIYQGITDGLFNVNGYFLQTDCPISGGDSGGPMVDENGYVVGISVLGNESFYLCVASDVVMPVLETLNIPHIRIDPTSVTPLNLGELRSAIDKAKGLDAGSYPAESFRAVTTALTAAEEAEKLELPEGADEATRNEIQAKIDEATKALNGAMDDLEKSGQGPKSGSESEPESGQALPMAAIIGIIVAIVALIAVIAAVMASRKKKGAQPATPAAPTPVGTAAPDGSSDVQTWQKPASEGEVVDDTIVLFQAANGGSLTRLSTNEQIPINCAEFTIGRERSKVNYCIEDKPAIGRIHARFVVRDGKVYLVDNKAKNGTYVNGVKCRPGEEVLLKGGETIELADEKFKYSK